jgi:CheY-like chemotaxis protein
LVDDVLDLSQVEAGRMALSKEWTFLPNIIRAAARAVRDLLDSKGLYLELDLPADLPPVFCDSIRIRQVVLNLLSNASRFTEQGGVRIQATQEGNRVVVSVTDTGPGIAPQDQERLFEPFQQLDSSIRRRHGGSGLGLSISKRFVEMHGGKMWLESEVEIGTTFHFSLPLDVSPLAISVNVDDARRWFSPYSEYEYKIHRGRSKAEAPVVLPRVVVLEDGETLQRLLARYLDGYEVSSVRDVQEAIHELNRSPAQALIINMPSPAGSSNGLEGLTSLPYGTPAISCWVPGTDEIAQHMGAVRYLVKPIARDTLLATLEDLGEEIKSVLVVDDQPDVLQLFARMLSSGKQHYRVLRAESGQRALSLLQRRPDVMLLDLIMPGMDGFQLLQEKERDASVRDIPVVIVSSRDPEGEPIVSDHLTISRAGGLSLRNLLACIQAVSEILSPLQPGDRAPQERPVV